RPIVDTTVSRSMPQILPIAIENKGMAAPPRIADMAVPMRGGANDRPTSWPATVVAPTTASGHQPLLKSSLRRVMIAMNSSTVAAINARKVTTPAQPKARTARSMMKNDEPHVIARNKYEARLRIIILTTSLNVELIISTMEIIYSITKEAAMGD